MTNKIEYEIKITKLESWTETEKQNYLLKETPTNITEKDVYGGQPRVLMEKQWSGPVDVNKEKSSSETIFSARVKNIDLAQLSRVLFDTIQVESNQGELKFESVEK